MDDRDEHGEDVDQAIQDDQAVQAGLFLPPDDHHRQAVDNQGEAQDREAAEDVHIVSWLVYFHCLFQCKIDKA